MRFILSALLLVIASTYAGAEKKPTHFKSPQLLNKVSYEYPPKARKLEVEATVYIKLTISDKGRVEKVAFNQIKLSKPTDTKKLEKELKQAFKKSVRASIKKARFKPATQKGEPVSSTAITAVKFVLK